MSGRLTKIVEAARPITGGGMSCDCVRKRRKQIEIRNQYTEPCPHLYVGKIHTSMAKLAIRRRRAGPGRLPACEVPRYVRCRGRAAESPGTGGARMIKDRVFIVTGAGSGLGAATARGLVAAGA